MRIRLVSRASALATLQAELVRGALRARWPEMEITLLTRSSEGDRDRRVELWTAAEKGLFTADLSRMVADGAAEAAIHSWKDLPIDGHPGTRVAAALERADPRDVLLVRRDAVRARPTVFTVLSSSLRRAWQIRASAPHLLPWTMTELRIAPVRGNVPTRLAKLARGEGDALIVAKAALDRLLSSGAPTDAQSAVREALDQFRWMVLPLKEHPAAPAQGAIAIEVARARDDVAEWVAALNHEPTWRAAEREREILASFGGGCHEAIGATVLVRDYGVITSVRARLPDGSEAVEWSLETDETPPPRASNGRFWPRRDERDLVRRRMLDVNAPQEGDGMFVTRAEALPARWTLPEDQLIWTSGSRTWARLARRGLWVNGCADGLGDNENPAVDVLAGRPVLWRRLTHADADAEAALATYVVDRPFPPDLEQRTHFFWPSGSTFLSALAAYPSIREGWHASGPGRTARVIRDTLGTTARVSVWLDYEQWHQSVTS